MDVLSNGRLELIGGRGVYAQHYAQFGQDAERGEALLMEAVRLLKRLWTEENVTWEGTIRPPLHNVTVRPRPIQRPHPPIWLSASSTASIERAVALQCPIMIPTVSCRFETAASRAALYRKRWAEAGHDPALGKVGLHVHLHVAVGDSDAIRAHWKPYQLSYLRWVYDELRGPETPVPPTHQSFGLKDSQAVCGNVDFVIKDILRRFAEIGGADEFLIQCDQGGLPEAEVRACLELFAERVLPVVAERPGG